MAVPTFPEPSVARHEEGFLKSRDHLRLFWQRFTPPAPRATVALLHGYCDHSGRYAGMTRALCAAGLEVALVDFRGHGQSDGRRSHVDAFGDYLDDLDAFLAHVRAAAGGRRLFLAGHSQGALVAALWAVVRGRGGEGLGGLVLSSPYFRLALTPPWYKVAAARLLDHALPWLPMQTGLRFQDLTSDPEMQAWTQADRLYGRVATPRWFGEFQKAQAEVLRRAGELRAPLLVLAAGADAIADPRVAEEFVARAGSADKRFERLEGMQHEIWNERERARPIAEAVAWVRARAEAEG
ncbi:alpha/beta hydrolase [Anaeromyxobacter paludicola]|uniref:Hydrolase n=1 Tax=Anaeromyxobacter paludicola TaxID=2918171 RepID=A0ABM7XAH9_9BACT|nr:alpha/beta hydrolase [Anaeromyxobacter paludicola]BDG08864.1 hydrolase [Anaeromyxobacter paludicola]